jgi:hypothetical protein
LRYRTNVEKRTLYEVFSAPALSMTSSKEDPLINSILKLHDFVNDVSNLNGLRISNRICLKNCLCIGIIETLRCMNGLNNRKHLAEFYENMVSLLTYFKDAFIPTNDLDFESKFRLKYEGAQHLNFKIFNSYDYGLLYNILNYGVFFHSRRFLYAKKQIVIDNTRKEEVRKILLTHYAKATFTNNNEKIFIFPNPDGNYSLPIAKDKKDSMIEYFVDPQGLHLTPMNGGKIVDAYLKTLAEYKKLVNTNSLIDDSTDMYVTKTTISKEDKKVFEDSFTTYLNDTSGLFRGNFSANKNILENVKAFPNRFVEQIEGAALELDFINFNLA